MKKIFNIYASFRRLSLFTQVWMMAFLGPAVFMPLLVLDGPLGPWMAVLSILGFAPALFLLWNEEGFSKKMAVGHLIFWPPLVLMLAWSLATQAFEGSMAAAVYAFVGSTFLISLLFDIREVKQLVAGQRSIA